MKFCSRCGAEIVSEDKFCKNCGSNLVDEQKPISVERTQQSFVKEQLQEQIKESKTTMKIWAVLSIIGALFAMFPVFLDGFIRLLSTLNTEVDYSSNAMDQLVWTLPAGISFCVVSIVVVMLYERKYKKLVKKLGSQNKE